MAPTPDTLKPYHQKTALSFVLATKGRNENDDCSGGTTDMYEGTLRQFLSAVLLRPVPQDLYILCCGFEYGGWVPILNHQHINSQSRL